MKPGRKRFALLAEFGVLLALVAEMAIFSTLSPYFFTSENILNVSLQTSIIAIIAAGMTFVILTAGIDLSVGSVVAFTGVIATALLQLDLPVPRGPRHRRPRRGLHRRALGRGRRPPASRNSTSRRSSSRSR